MSVPVSAASPVRAGMPDSAGPQPLVIVGAGGHGRELAQLVRDINRQAPAPRWNMLGFLDDNPEKVGARLGGHEVLGDSDWLGQSPVRDVRVAVAIGDAKIRKLTVSRLARNYPDLKFATLVHPTAVVADDAVLGEGAVVCALSVVSTGVAIGEHALVHYGSTVGHDATVEPFASVLPGCRISGNATIGEVADVGAGATVLPGIAVGAYAIVGAGAVVTRPVPERCTAVGIPARPIRFGPKR